MSLCKLSFLNMLAMHLWSLWPMERLLNQPTTQDCNCCCSEGFVSLAATHIRVLAHCNQRCDVLQ